MEQEVRSVPSAPRAWKVINGKLVFTAFIVLVSVLIFFAFTGDSITGNAVNEVNEETGEIIAIGVEAHLSSLVEPLVVKQDGISRVVLTVQGSSSKLFIGRDGVTDLSGVGTAVIDMSDFSGVLSFDGSSVSSLKGSVSKLSINGLPTAATGSEIRIAIEEPLSYTQLEMGGVSLREYSVDSSSGTVSLNGGKISLNLDDESFVVEDFVGVLRSGETVNQGISHNGLFIDGHASHVEVGGEYQMSISR